MTLLRKNGRIVGGPTVCEGAVHDREVTISYVGKSRFSTDASFHGEISRLFIADEIIGNRARACTVNNARGEGPACNAMQSSTWTADSGTQYFRDQRISGVGGFDGLAANAVDGSTGTCSQSWREGWPWWRVDLEVPRLITSVRVFGRTDCCHYELQGFEVRVGNWPTWDNNPVCERDVRAPADATGVDVMCQAEGRYVFVVLPGANRSLALCEVEVNGLPNAATSAVISGPLPNCTSCIPGVGCECV